MALVPGIGGPAGGGMLAALQQRASSIHGAGLQAEALVKLKNAIALLESALPGLATGSAEHSATVKAITDLSKHVPTGESSAGIQMSQLRDLMGQIARSAILSRASALGAPGGAQPMAGPAPPVPGV